MKLNRMEKLLIFSFLALYMLIVLTSIAGWHYGGYDIVQEFKDEPVQPSFHHPFGLDRSGYDIFVRFCVATANGFKYSIITVSTFILAGIGLGIGISYARSKLFTGLMKFIFNLIGSYPILILLFLAAIYLQEYTWIMLPALMALFGLFRSHDLAELIRQRVSYLRQLNFIEACTALGLPYRVIIFKHILLNECLGIILVQGAIMMGQAILMETTLTYLDFGETESQGNVTWGSMLNRAKSLFDRGLLQTEYMVPTLAIAVFPFMFMVLANILKDKFVVSSQPGVK